MPWTDVFRNKRQKHAKAVQRKTLYQTKYETCKQSKKNKGKPVYPEEGGKKCKSQYNKWQKHRGKEGERALNLSNKLDKKGKLSPELQAELDEDIKNAARETRIDPVLTDSELAMMNYDLEGELDTLPDVDAESNTILYVIGAVAVVGLIGGVLLLRR